MAKWMTTREVADLLGLSRKTIYRAIRDGQRHRSRSFTRKSDAGQFEAMVQRARERGETIDFARGQESLAEHCVVYWRRVVAGLASNTRAGYRVSWANHLEPRLGSLRLRDITPAVVEGLRADLDADGVGPAALRKALALLSGMLTAAVRWDRIDRNPVSVVGLPSGSRRRHVRPLAPADVEAIRARLLAGSHPERDAVLLGLLA